MRRSDAGLTLLEVLGAVALLGLVYTLLARSAAEGMRSEGESRRRLEASLLADDRMAEIELALAAGSVPKLGSTQEAVDDFSVRTEVRAFEPPPKPKDAERAAGRPRSLAAKRAAREKREAPSLFAAPKTPGAEPALRSVEIVVRWMEGIDERSVRRTTFAVDQAAIEPLFAQLANAKDLAAKPEGESPRERRRRERTAKQQATQKAAGKGSKQAPQEAPLPNFEIPAPGEGDEGEP